MPPSENNRPPALKFSFKKPPPLGLLLPLDPATCSLSQAKDEVLSLKQYIKHPSPYSKRTLGIRYILAVSLLLCSAEARIRCHYNRQRFNQALAPSDTDATVIECPENFFCATIKYTGPPGAQPAPGTWIAGVNMSLTRAGGHSELTSIPMHRMLCTR